MAKKGYDLTAPSAIPEAPGKEDAAIVASPMVRTLQTAELGLGWLTERGVTITGDADWQGKYTFS